MMKKTTISLLITLDLLFLPMSNQAEELPTITVYKSPTCGCCKSWVKYMRDNDFVVNAVDLSNLDALKKEHSITPELQSCHTALIDGYIIEGHVPADDVKRLLKDRPDVAGLSARGMPAKAPGMGSIVPKDYTVFSFDKTGKVEAYSEY